MPLSTVEEYDPVTDKWKKKADMPTARFDFATSTVNGKIYAIGGVGWGVGFSTVEEYDPVKDKWTKKSDMPTVRGAVSSSAVNGKIYAVGGEMDKVLPTVEEYDTGFAGKSIEARGKLTTTWGEVRRAGEKVDALQAQ